MRAWSAVSVCTLLVTPSAGEAQPLDSLVLVREAGYWERTAPRDDRVYSYRLVITTDGELRFEAVDDDQAIHAESFDVPKSTVDSLLSSASAIDLSDVPDALMGKRPWCEVVRTDAHTVVLELFRARNTKRLAHYQGCPVTGDQSGDQLVARLLDLERRATQLLNLEQRFSAAPLAYPVRSEPR